MEVFNLSNLATNLIGIAVILFMLDYRLKRLEKDVSEKMGELKKAIEDHEKEFVSKEILAEKLGRIDERILDVRKDVHNAHDKIRAFTVGDSDDT